MCIINGTFWTCHNSPEYRGLTVTNLDLSYSKVNDSRMKFLFIWWILQADRCVRDLDVPHFHHEITFESIQIALENGTDTVINEILALLKHFSDGGMISVDQMTTVSTLLSFYFLFNFVTILWYYFSFLLLILFWKP